MFLIYTQIENHVLNPIIMSKTVRISPLLVLVSVLVGASIGSWIGGLFGGLRRRAALHPGCRARSR